MKVNMTLVGAIVVSLAIAGCATTGGAPVKYSDGIMVDGAGMTLYTYDRDTVGSGKSVCNQKCAVAWPPLKVAADAKPGGEFTIITRDDGSTQWAHKGKPLYFWVKDQKPGDRTGDGWNSVWHVIKQ